MIPPTETAVSPVEAVSGTSVCISSRVAALFILLFGAAALGCRFLDSEATSTAALKVVCATLLLAVAPGALATLLWRPRRQLTALEVVGYGIAISFGVVQLLTMLAVSAHMSPAVMTAALLIASALIAGRVMQRPAGSVVVSPDELIVTVLLVALGVLLYLQGSPADSFEDQVHVAIVRRLSQLEHPAIDNLYFSPGIVYTYPFPGTHYFMGLVARLGDIDALFLYHKLRFFWGPAALVMLYLAARAVYGSPAVACAVTVTAVVLVCSGVFAMVAGFPWGWGQLAPFSHASDVAMTVLLPALLVVAFGYLQAGSTRERAFFFASTAMLTLMLTIVHVREIVQFAVYLGCFFVVSTAFRDFRSYVRPTMVLLALTVAVAATYTVWQAGAVSLVTDIVDEQRAKLVSTATSSSLQALLFAPAPALLSDFVQSFEPIFGGLTPFFLFAGPAVILLFRRQALVWLISSSIVTYLLVMTVPLVAIPYVYLTYYEILITPVRNVIFFVYLFAGALLYVTVVALTRIDRTRISPVVAGAAGGVLALLTALCLNRSHYGFFAPLIAAYGLTLLFLWGGPLTRRIQPRAVVAMLVSMLALVALWPDHQPVPRSEEVSVRWTSGFPEARRVDLERQFSLGHGEPKHDRTEEVNVWNYRLTDFSVDNVRRIVTHPDALDTNGINRPRFAVPLHPPRTDHPALGVQYVTWLQYPGLMLLVGTAVAVWGLGLVVPAVLASSRGRLAAASLEPALREPFYRFAVPFALCLIAFALWSARPSLSPLTLAPMPPAGRVTTPRAMIARIPCVTTGRMPVPFIEDILPGVRLTLPDKTACPPDSAVIEWVHAHVAPDAVFAIDRWNPFLPSVFMPQQVVVFPEVERSFVHEQDLFRGYYRFFDERMRRYRVQPFFNSVETLAEREAFIRALGVTHVLVDPSYYDEIRPVLDGLPEQFTLGYSDGKWAVYEVRRVRG